MSYKLPTIALLSIFGFSTLHLNISETHCCFFIEIFVFIQPLLQKWKKSFQSIIFFRTTIKNRVQTIMYPKNKCLLTEKKFDEIITPYYPVLFQDSSFYKIL